MDPSLPSGTNFLRTSREGWQAANSGTNIIDPERAPADHILTPGLFFAPSHSHRGFSPVINRRVASGEPFQRFLSRLNFYRAENGWNLVEGDLVSGFEARVRMREGKAKPGV